MKPTNNEQINRPNKRRQHLYIDITNSLNKVQICSSQSYKKSQKSNQIINNSLIHATASTTQNANTSSMNTEESINTMKRNNSNNSIMQQLEVEDQGQFVKEVTPEQRLMIKISDGLYIGGEYSIWDTDTMTINYITHLITIQSHPTPQQPQKYVPDIIEYIHSINLPLKISDNHKDNSNQQDIMEVYSKIARFVQHAHDGGQSCIIVCRGVDLEDDFDDGRAFRFVYQPAAIACGYLMYRYKWSLLKGLQFVGSRLSAGHKSTQTLQKINQKLKSTHNQPHNHPNLPHTSLQEQLLTHLLPQLPHLNADQAPNISQIPIQTLTNLEKRLLDGYQLSYNWLVGVGICQEELVLVNTYHNCMIDSQLSYHNILTNNNTKSMNNIGLTTNNRSSRQSLKPKSRHPSTNKKSAQKDPDHKKHHTSHHNISINTIHKKSADKIVITRNSISKKSKKRVSWKQQLVQYQQSCQFLSNTHQPNSKQKLVQHNKQEQPSMLKQDLQEYKKNINNIYKICDNISNSSHCSHANSQRSINYKQITSIPGTDRQSSLLQSYQQNHLQIDDSVIPKSNTVNVNVNVNANNVGIKLGNKNRIVVNVINIINSRNRQTDRSNTNTNRQSQPLNKKKKIYQSKTRLPTLQDILATNNNSTNINTNTHDKIITKCKTLSNVNLNASDSQHKINIDDFCLSQGNQLDRISRNNHKSNPTKYSTANNSQEKQNYNKANMMIYTNTNTNSNSNSSKQINYGTIAQKQEEQVQVNEDKSGNKEKIVAATMDKLKKIKNGLFVNDGKGGKAQGRKRTSVPVTIK